MAEFAVALPAVLLVLALVTGTARLAVAQVGAVDAARAGARAAARGDDEGLVRATALALAPTGSAVSVATGPGTVTVRVSSSHRLAGPLGGRFPVTASATAALETAGAPVAGATP